MSDGGYIRLKQVTLSYDFPQSLLSSIGMRSAKNFCSGHEPDDMELSMMVLILKLLLTITPLEYHLHSVPILWEGNSQLVLISDYKLK
jgi:hypothetical protein